MKRISHDLILDIANADNETLLFEIAQKKNFLELDQPYQDAEIANVLFF